MKKKNKLALMIVAVLVVLAAAAGILYWKMGGSELLAKLASSDTFNKGEYIKPDYDVDGVLDEAIWKDAPCITFGNSETETDEVTFRYYYGERGITASFVVTDPTICYASNAIDNSQIFKLSDAVFLYLDVKNDGEITPQKDDVKFCIAADGRMAVAKGSGSNWVYTNDSIDYQVVVDGELNKSDGGAMDKSWTTELFIPYKTFGIDKDAVMGMMLEWDDSNTPSGSATRYIWYDGGNGATVLPELFHPIDKNGLAFAAPENWVPSMGRFVEDGENGMIADDIRALAYYRGETLENGAGTVEATFDLTQTEDFFSIPRFSGLLLGVEEVGETEKPGWEAKNQYGVFISNSATNPQLVVASIRLDEEGKVTYKQIAGGNILDAVPDFVESKICSVKVAKNDGWIEIYIKNTSGKWQHLYDVYDIEPINGNYIGVRTAVKGFAVRDVKVTKDAPASPNPYKGSDVKIYSGLLQKLNANEFYARTAGTTATFGSLVNKYGTKELKTITTSVTFGSRPDKPEDKIKGILLNYNPDDQSYLIMDYRHGESKGKEWEEDWKIYIRQRKSDGWGDVAFVMSAEADTTYDFRITPIENVKGATEVYVEYKKQSETEWKSTYCKQDAWVMSGSEYGIQTATGDMRFGAFKQENLGYTRLDTNRYETKTGMFFGRTDGGAQVMTQHSMAIDKTVKLKGQDSYMLHGSFNVVPDQSASIKGIIFNYDETDGSYLVLDYRWIERDGIEPGYRLYVRQYDGKKWGDTKGYDVILTENAWYDFNIHVVNGKKTTTVIVEWKTGDGAYEPVSRTFSFGMSGRNAGYYSTAANGMQFGELTTGTTTYIGAEDSRYDVKMGAFFRNGNDVQVATKNSLMIDKNMNPRNSDIYAFETGFQAVADKGNSIKGIVFDYDEDNGSYLVLDYRYVKEAYRLYIRQYDGKKWGDTQGLDVVLEENAWYNFKVHVINGAKSTTVVVEYAKEGETLTSVSRTFNFAMTGRKMGHYSTAANNMQFHTMQTALTTYIGAGDNQYDLLKGAFFRINGGVQVAAKESLLLDKTIDLSAKDNYTIETSFKVVPDKNGSIKGIVLGYDRETGSYAVLDYRWIERDGIVPGYRLYIRRYDGEQGQWADTTGLDLILTENETYHFQISMYHQSGSTRVYVSYKTGTSAYQRISKTLNYVLTGREVGYYSTAANSMQFGTITEVKSSETGVPWPEDWKDALKSLSK